MGRVLISAQRLHLDTAFAGERGVSLWAVLLARGASAGIAPDTAAWQRRLAHAPERFHWATGRACTDALRRPWDALQQTKLRSPTGCIVRTRFRT
ncbi:hypothetical protein XAR_0307 [Xanthomonas citri pv. glycines str. 8ra]|nr:hypothetical protein XAR_0307 [Xanthomonas citri pv. glycines str. 8ra]CEJ43245.1 hypothetical protein XAB3213_1880002 [Xanthomonas citri pv. bilvae]